MSKKNSKTNTYRKFAKLEIPKDGREELMNKYGTIWGTITGKLKKMECLADEAIADKNLKNHRYRGNIAYDYIKVGMETKKEIPVISKLVRKIEEKLDPINLFG